MPDARWVSDATGDLWRGPQGLTLPRLSTPDGPPPPAATFDPTTYDYATLAGVPAGTTLAPFTQQDISGGTVYDARDVPYNTSDWYMDVTGMDTGFTNSVVRQSVRVANTGARFTADHCDLFAGRANCVAGPSTVRHCHVKLKGNDGIVASVGSSAAPSTIPVLIEYNLIEGPDVWGGPVGNEAHHDGVQVWHGSNITIRRNKIFGNFHTSNIILKCDYGVIDNVLIEENWFSMTPQSPSGTTTYSRVGFDSAAGVPTNVTFLNNAFGPNRSPISVQPDQVFVRTEAERTNPAWIVWNGNRLVDSVGNTTAENIAPPNGWS